MIRGTTFSINSIGQCILVPIDKVDTSVVGHASNMTKDQFIQLSQMEFSGIGTIKDFNVINYNTSIISLQVNLVNGSSLYEDLTR